MPTQVGPVKVIGSIQQSGQLIVAGSSTSRGVFPKVY